MKRLMATSTTEYSRNYEADEFIVTGRITHTSHLPYASLKER